MKNFSSDVKVDLQYYDLPGLHTLKENRYRQDAAEIGWENLTVTGKDRFYLSFILIIKATC